MNDIISKEENEDYKDGEDTKLEAHSNHSKTMEGEKGLAPSKEVNANF